MATKSFLYNPTLTRGIRNNNPGNLRINKSNNWQGKINSSDKEFEQFINIAFGLRALMITLRTYQNKHGLRTIRQIINRWAPGSENNTNKYIDAVAGSMSLSPNAELDLSSKSILVQLAKAIVKHECSPDHYRITDEDYFEAYDLMSTSGSVPAPTSGSGAAPTSSSDSGSGTAINQTETPVLEKKPLPWFAIAGVLVALVCTYLLFKK